MAHVMSLDEMIAAEPLAATEAPPRRFEAERRPRLVVESDDLPELTVRAERLEDVEGASLWGVEVLSQDALVLPGVHGKRQVRVPLKKLRGDGAASRISDHHRPPWLDGEFMPRLAPRRDGGPGSILRMDEVLGTAWPWCTVGKVWFGAGADFSRRVAGSGVLVGRDLMLTCSHGVPWGASPWWIEFVPSFRAGEEPFGGSYVSAYWGVPNDDDVTGLDYVICRLYNPLGDRCGWMGTQWWSSEDPYYDGSWTSVGYPRTFMSGQRPAVEFGIGVRDIDDEGDGLEIETVKFAEPGWSGGPLWGFIDGHARVIGIESGYEKDFLDPTRTVFAGGEYMVSLVSSPPI